VQLYAWLKIAKVLGVALLFAGTIGAFLPRDLADRRRAAYALAAPGFGVTWAAGFGLAAVTSTSLMSGWVLSGIVLSLFALQVVLYGVGKDGRRRAAALAIAPLVVTAALMVLRPF
jgi:hypothetical protein